jgi:hypothetical protein
MKQVIKRKAVIFYTRCWATFKSTLSKFKFKIFKNEGQEMLFVAIGTFICFSILLFLRLRELLQ